MQFIKERNDAELIGNVIAKQDSLTILYGKNFLFWKRKKSRKYPEGVKLDDQKVILTADTGDYFFNEDKAFFRHKCYFV